MSRQPLPTLARLLLYQGGNDSMLCSAARAVMIAALLSTPAVADDQVKSDRSDAQARAQFAYKEAMRLFQAGEYRTAVAKLEESSARFPHPNTIYFLAESHRRLGELRRSHAAYQRYAATLPAAEREVFARKLAALRAQADVALAISTTPGGAQVRVDGAVRGATPRDGTALVLTLGGGRRVVELALDGHGPLRQEIEAEFGEPRALSVALRPRPRPATLHVESTARESVIVVDGRDHGAAPRRLELPAGPHELVVSAAGRELLRRRLLLAAGDRLLVSATLAPPAGAVDGACRHAARPSPTWLLAGGAAGVLAAASLAVGVAYNVKHNAGREGAPELGGYRAASTTGYALAGALAAGAVTSLVLHFWQRRGQR